MTCLKIILIYHLILGILISLNICLTCFLYYLYKSKNKGLLKTVSKSDFDNLIFTKMLNVLDCDNDSDKKIYDKNEFISTFIVFGYASLMPYAGMILNLTFITLIIWAIFMSKKDLSELSQNIKINEIENHTPIIKKYFKKETPFLMAIIVASKHPYRALIKENLIKVLEIIEDKENELELTLNEKRKANITNDINNLVLKFNDFTSKLNTNFIKSEREQLISFNNELIKLNNNLKEKSLTITDFINNYKLPNKSNKTEVEEKISLMSTYFAENDNNISILKKLLSINKTSYCNAIMEVADILIDDITSIELKIKFMNFELRQDIEEEIRESIKQYILLLINLDNIYLPSTDKRTCEYIELLDSVIEDIENKKAIF